MFNHQFGPFTASIQFRLRPSWVSAKATSAAFSTAKANFINTHGKHQVPENHRRISKSIEASFFSKLSLRTSNSWLEVNGRYAAILNRLNGSASRCNRPIYIGKIYLCARKWALKSPKLARVCGAFQRCHFHWTAFGFSWDMEGIFRAAYFLSTSLEERSLYLHFCSIFKERNFLRWTCKRLRVVYGESWGFVHWRQWMREGDLTLLTYFNGVRIVIYRYIYR